MSVNRSFSAQNQGLARLSAIFVFAAATWTMGCACPQKDQLATVVDRDRALLTAPTTPHEHARLTLTFDAVNRQAKDLVGANELRRSVGLGALGKAKLRLRPVTMVLSASESCASCVGVDLEFELSVSLSGAAALALAASNYDPSARHRGRIHLVAPLRIAVEEQRSSLELRADDALTINTDLAQDRLPSVLRGPAAEAVANLVPALLSNTLGSVALIELPAIELVAGAGVRPISLSTHAERETLSVGLTFDIDSPPAALSQADELPISGDIRLTVGLGSIRDLTRTLFADKTLPRRYTTAGEPDKNGPIAASIEAVRERDGELELELRLFHTDWPCFSATLIGAGVIEKSDQNQFHARVHGVQLVEADRFEEEIEAALWRTSLPVDTIADASSEALNAHTLQIGALRLVLTPTRYSIVDDALSVTASIAPAP